MRKQFMILLSAGMLVGAAGLCAAGPVRTLAQEGTNHSGAGEGTEQIMETGSEGGVSRHAGAEKDTEKSTEESSETGIGDEVSSHAGAEKDTEKSPTEGTETSPRDEMTIETYSFDESWPYAQFSVIHSDSVTLTIPANDNGITVAVNAGHGCAGGESVQTQSHPDGTPKVTGGTNAMGAVMSMAISTGTTFLDGTSEAYANETLAQLVKTKLLEEHFRVLMLRDGADAQLDNIARTVFANNLADCHIALHYDSTDYDKGFYYVAVPQVSSYLSMEPVASHYQEHERLGKCLTRAEYICGAKVYNGRLETDLTQTSYSTVPSVDVEVGDRASDYSEQTQSVIASGIVLGVKLFFNIGETGQR